MIFRLIAASAASFISAFLFLESVNFAADVFQTHWQILVWLTPLAGGILAYILRHPYFKNCEKDLSPELVPFTFITACWSHIFGASVGREAAAIQVGSSMTEWLRKKLIFRSNPKKFSAAKDAQQEDQEIFLHAGTAAAFSAVLGAPISSIFFAVEYRKKGGWPHIAASFLGALVGWSLEKSVPHSRWIPPLIVLEWTDTDFLHLLLFVLAAALIVQAYHQIEKLGHWLTRPWPLWINLTVSGMMLSLGTMMLSQPIFNNYGIELMNQSFHNPSPLWLFAGKLFFTWISLAGGWQGGVFIPMMVSGTLMGSYLSQWAQLPLGVGAGLGLFAFINGRFQIPWTCVLLTAELLDWRLGLLSLPLHYLARRRSG